MKIQSANVLIMLYSHDFFYRMVLTANTVLALIKRLLNKHIDDDAVVISTRVPIQLWRTSACKSFFY